MPGAEAPEVDEARAVGLKVLSVACTESLTALRLQEKGNTMFKQGLYRRALHAYQLAKRDFDCLYSGSPEEVARANVIRLPCILNIAACHQKLKEWRRADEACALALNIDERCVKALFRRAQVSLLAWRTYDFDP